MTPDPVFWFLRAEPQAVPSGVWTPVGWDWAVVDTEGVRPELGADPQVPLPHRGLYAAVVGVSFEFDPHGHRGVRFVQEGFPVACAGPVPGVGPVAGWAAQTVQCVMQPGTHLDGGSSFTVEVWQNSGRVLRLVPDGIQAPIIMAGYLGASAS